MGYQVQMMLWGPPDPDASFAEKPFSIVRACTVGVDVNEPVGVHLKAVAVQSCRFSRSLGQVFIISPTFLL